MPFRRKTTGELGPSGSGDHPLPELIVLLDDVRSMHNVGSAFRTCDAFGVQALYLCGYTPAPPHRDIQKTALGATETVPWKKFATIAEAMDEARAQGFAICCAEQAHGSLNLTDAAAVLPRKLAIVFGNEVTGVSDEALQSADYCLEIPQRGAKHSLNISVTVGVIVWELTRK